MGVAERQSSPSKASLHPTQIASDVNNCAKSLMATLRHSHEQVMQTCRSRSPLHSYYLMKHIEGIQNHACVYSAAECGSTRHGTQLPAHHPSMSRTYSPSVIHSVCLVSSSFLRKEEQQQTRSSCAAKLNPACPPTSTYRCHPMRRPGSVRWSKVAAEGVFAASGLFLSPLSAHRRFNQDDNSGIDDPSKK